ncbi:diguanylate cyclase [bacterium]|nr:GGDEF domain-containing protein [Candidatus Omnitrophota bacterium]MBU4123424.1 diguanylate cyclase [bacterium]
MDGKENIKGFEEEALEILSDDASDAKKLLGPELDAIAKEEKFFSHIIHYLTGLRTEEEEARTLWSSILEHKYLMSEKLFRNVGFRVAALDYFLNIDKRLKRVNFVEINKMKKIWFEASYDSLTRVLRKDVMDYWFTCLSDEASADNKNLAIIFFDVDGFKKYNDRLGHLAGDAALYEIARVMRKFSEKVFRFGGDEFVIMAHLDKDAARELAGKITDKIRPSTQALEKAESSLGVSFGIAVYPADGGSLKELLSVADSRLYKNKENRRKG